jgi:hypothetical protein
MITKEVLDLIDTQHIGEHITLDDSSVNIEDKFEDVGFHLAYLNWFYDGEQSEFDK